MALILPVKEMTQNIDYKRTCSYTYIHTHTVLKGYYNNFKVTQITLSLGGRNSPM